MDNRFSRMENLLGKEALLLLADAKVAVFGLGGVGSYAAEALARGGIGRLDLYDHDVVSITNINRQLIALEDTIGQKKVEVMRDRIQKINPNSIVRAYDCFYMPDIADQIDLSEYDYIIDAIDTVTAKIELIIRAKAGNIPIISCMGTGNKLDPSMLEVSDIYKTSVCPLAKVMRKELKARGIKKCKVVYSKENPIRSSQSMEHESDEQSHKRIPGSVSFVPPVAGMIMAGEVIREISFGQN